MKLLITGICGFVGNSLALELRSRMPGLEIAGIDNLSRAGSEQNRHSLQQHGIKFFHGDVRQPSDMSNLPQVDWVLDAAANPSVLAGVVGQTSSRQLMEHNLFGTIHLLEFCKAQKAGLILLSTSRVYSLAKLAALPMDSKAGAFQPRFKDIQEPGFSTAGVAESFSTQPPLSLYGAAKLASEVLALEYGLAFGFPVMINRCGVLAGARQFGRPDQGIFSYWIHSYRNKRPLKYIGFNGTGHQVRDCMHPQDLAALVAAQLSRGKKQSGIWNAGGGTVNALSLGQLNRWCLARFGPHEIETEPNTRPFDVPWLALDCSAAAADWNWRPGIAINAILEEIAVQAEKQPDWLDLSNNS